MRHTDATRELHAVNSQTAEFLHPCPEEPLPLLAAGAAYTISCQGPYLVRSCSVLAEIVRVWLVAALSILQPYPLVIMYVIYIYICYCDGISFKPCVTAANDSGIFDIQCVVY